jgi:tetratricopeptide (TPR) repeat protein
MPPHIDEAEVRKAVETVRQRVLDRPDAATAWGELGMTLFANQYEREGDQCLAEAARLAPTFPVWPYCRAVIALDREDFAAALPFLREALALASAGDGWSDLRPPIRARLAEVLLERQEYAEAERLFKQELARDPNDLRAAFGLGMIARARGDDREAADLFTSARRSPYARKKAAVQLAALAGIRRDPAAAEHGREAAGLPDDPPWPDPVRAAIAERMVGHRRRVQEATLYEQANRFGDAAQVYLKELEVKPSVRAYVGAGISLSRIGDYARGLPLLRKAVEFDPNSAEAHHALAMSLYARTKKLWEDSPDDPDLKRWLREMIEHARRATELQPDLALSYLFWGVGLKRLGEPDEAIAPLRRGVACEPGEIELQLALGEALLEARKPGEAETHLENARKLDPNDPRPVRALERLRKKG